MPTNRKARNRRKEIIRRLDKGTDDFNSWREHNPRVYIELEAHDFRGRDLRGVNFRAAKLKKADFSSATLHNADFRGANLNDAKLVQAELTGADMSQTRLAGADLTRAILDGANLYATIRDGWKINEVVCQHCWITRDRNQFPEEPDRFEKGEFEIAHGGRRIRVKFPNGFQPIDLLALPYHARNILDRYAGKRIIFVGLSTVGEASLEFRVEDIESSGLDLELQEQFTDSVVDVRRNTEAHLRALLEVREEQTRDQRRTIGVLSRILEQESQYRGRGDFNFLIGGDVNLAGAARALGRGASADEVSYLSVWNELASSVDMEKLSMQLGVLKKALEDQSMTEQARQVSVAEQEIARGNGAKALQYLKKAGHWAFKAATDIGAEVAASAIKQSLGIS